MGSGPSINKILLGAAGAGVVLWLGWVGCEACGVGGVNLLALVLVGLVVWTTVGGGGGPPIRPA